MAATRTIGLLTSWIYSNYNMNLWTGIAQGARARNYNLITYRGNAITQDPSSGHIRQNTVYDNIDADGSDGFLLVSTSIANEITPAVYADFCARFKPKPIVSIGAAPAFVHTCLIDNSSGFYHLTAHLIRAHGCRSLAYLGGPKGSQEAVIRYDAFRKALADNGLEFNQALFNYGNFQRSRGRTAMQELLEKKIPFDAVVAANDDMALSASEVLQEAGYRVPEAVKVVGFDDIPDTLVAEPPLSTVRQPLYSQAYRAVNMLIDLLEDKPVDREEYIQTRPVLRRSCGCGQEGSAVKKAAFNFRKEYACGPEDRARIVLSVTDRMKTLLDAEKRTVVDALVALFDRDLADNGRTYLAKLQAVFSGVHDLNDLDVWQEVLSTIEKGFTGYLSEDRFPRFTDIIGGQEKLLNEKTMQVQSQKYAQSNNENRYLREVLQGLGYSFRISDIHDLMAASFNSRLGIASGYLLLFEDETGATSRLVAGFDRDGKLDLESHREAFPTRLLVGRDRNRLSGKSLFICPINLDEKDIGLIVLETGAASAFIYESAAAQLASSVWGSFLLRDSTASAEIFMVLNRKIEALVKPMIASIRQVTEIAASKMETIAELNNISLKSANKIAQTSDMIRGVSAKFNEMLDIISIIDGISTTVKIVSINASIEATHAGKFGSGFQVLAREINKLSESTRQNAENIAQTLKSVIDQVTVSMDASRESAASFKEQDQSVHELLDSLKTISELMGQLDSGSAQILTMMEKK